MANGKRKAGRPKGEERVRINAYVLPTTRTRIESEVDPKDARKSSMGKVVDLKFEEVKNV